MHAECNKQFIIMCKVGGGGECMNCCCSLAQNVD